MLEIRPSCEHCNKALLPDASDAMICTFECTFCRDCVESILHQVCPNWGGTFEKRPIRPKELLKKFPVSKKRIHKIVDSISHKEMIQNRKNND